MPKKVCKHKKQLVFLPLGGIGEIGMNLYLYGYGPERDRKWLMVDLGVTFAGPSEPGIDLIFPDTRFIEEEYKNLEAIVLTHAHEDHYGAVMALWPKLKAPLYATPFTAALLRAKLIEEGMEGTVPIQEIPANGSFEAGPFNVELVSMAHSIPETHGLFIHTKAGKIFHTSDWKLDPKPIAGAQTDIRRLQEIGDEGLDVLVCDSTNAMRDGTSPSEADVAESLQKIIADAPQRVGVTTFASNVARLRSIMDAATRADRHIVIVGRAMKRVIQVALETGHLPHGYDLLSEDDFGYIPRDKVLALCTGSQGEGRAALARIANGNHPRVNFTSGDMVLFSSRTIPGNEKAVGRIQNELVERGVDIMTDTDALIHVSGHPRRGELEQLYSWVRPRVAIPMHGEARHLSAQAELARKLGIETVISPRNGELAQLAPGPVKIIDETPSGRIHLDGKIMVPAGDGPVEERKRLAFAGAVAISVILSSKGDIVAGPQLTATGIPALTDNGTSLQDVMISAASGALESIPRARRKDSALVAEAVRRAVRSEANTYWGKKPPCSVMVTVI